MSCKYRVLLSLLVLVLVATSMPGRVSAELATSSEMETVCRNWLSYMVHERGSWAGDSNPVISDVRELEMDGIVLAHVYSIEPRGYIVVPMLKGLPPVKAYSERSQLDVDKTVGMTQLLRDILHKRFTHFQERYGSLEALQPSTGEVFLGREHRAEWDRFLAPQQEFAGRLAGGAMANLLEVGPLMTTSWDQTGPYNSLCPEGDGGTCLVGCVATAAAQILNYHEWPVCGDGQFTYYWSGDNSCEGSTPGQQLTADLRDPFDWDNMADRCGNCNIQERAALAELCYEVAVTFRMDFGVCASGAYTSDVQFVFPNYYRYQDTVDWEGRFQHTAESWFGIVQDEINAGRPILYTIPGHAIVCDGWRVNGLVNEYHINYGWDDDHTAWWSVDAIPGGDPGGDEDIYRYIQPPVNRACCIGETCQITSFANCDASGGEWMSAWDTCSPNPCEDWLVNPDGSGDYPTIQAAINASIVGNTIVLGDGVFTGDENRDIDLMGRALTIRSLSGDPTSCIIDCGGSAGDPHRGFIFTTDEGPDSHIEGITIRNGHSGGEDGGAAYCMQGTSPTFVNCIFEDNASNSQGGAVGLLESDITFTGCTFIGNSANNGGAIHGSSAAMHFVNCTFADNSGSYGGAIYGIGGSLTSENCIIAFNGPGEGFYSLACTGTFSCTDIYGNEGGDWVGGYAGQLGTNGNISEDPLFCDLPIYDVTLDEASCCAPFTPPNTECDLIGAWPTGCQSVLTGACCYHDESCVELTEIDCGSSGGTYEGLGTGCDPNPCPTSDVDEIELPVRLHLAPTNPNPFSRTTTITYAVPTGAAGSEVRLSVYDPAGRLVRTLVSEDKVAGWYTVSWDGRDEVGSPAASSVYFYELSIGGERLTKQVVLVR